MTASLNGAGAYNATVRVGDPAAAVQAAREQRLVDLEAAVTAVEDKLAEHADAQAAEDITAEQQDLLTKRKAALEAALEAARDEAERARAEAQKGSI